MHSVIPLLMVLQIPCGTAWSYWAWANVLRTVRADATQVRQRQLVRALNTNIPDLFVRAAEEIAMIEHLDAAIRRPLLDAVKQGEREFLFQSRRTVDALAAIGPAGIEDMIQVLKKRELAQEQIIYVLAGLGRMGPLGKEAVPFLRKQLNDAQLHRDRKALIRVVLANVGDDSHDIILGIVNDLRDGQQSAHVVNMMIHVAAHTWINDQIVRELTSPFEQLARKHERMGLLYEELMQYATSLGLSGKKGVSAAPHLKAAQERAIADKNICAIAFTLALCRIKPADQDATLRRFFKGGHQTFQHLERGDIVVLLEIPYRLVDTTLSIQLAQMLSDRDPKVVEGAAGVLWWAGLSARGAFTHVLSVLRTSRSTKTRVLAASVLGRIAPFRSLPELERTMKAEKSEEVQRQLAIAVEYIQLTSWKNTGRRFLTGYPFPDVDY